MIIFTHDELSTDQLHSTALIHHKSHSQHDFTTKSLLSQNFSVPCKLSRVFKTQVNIYTAMGTRRYCTPLPQII